MKLYNIQIQLKKIALFVVLSSFISCEEVVDVDLETASPRLVIDASINWDSQTSGNLQTIKLSKTTRYDESQIPIVSGATVFITNSSNVVFHFLEIPNTGNYVCTDFIPTINEQYYLTVVYNGETYIATEKLMPTPAILDVEQGNDLGINNDEIGLKINFLDFDGQRNYYLFRLVSTINPFPEYQIIDDQFSDGGIMSWLYSNEKLSSGNQLYFTQYGVSENYYNYMSLIINSSTGANNGPFQIIPTKARGNIINQTDSSNYALGYFRLCEIKSYQYIVQ